LISSIHKSIAAIGLALFIVNLLLAILVPLGLIRHVSSSLALELGMTYGVLSGAIVGACFYYIYQNPSANTVIAEQKLQSRFYRSPFAVGLFFFVITSFTGFGAIAHTAASLYTRSFGAPGSKTLTIVGSYRARWEHCNDHHFSEVPWRAKAGRVLCTDKAIEPGSRVKVAGYVSPLGLAVSNVFFEKHP
jgi:hypothetical protein